MEQSIKLQNASPCENELFVYRTPQPLIENEFDDYSGMASRPPESSSFEQEQAQQAAKIQVKQLVEEPRPLREDSLVIGKRSFAAVDDESLEVVSFENAFESRIPKKKPSLKNQLSCP